MDSRKYSGWFNRSNITTALLVVLLVLLLLFPGFKARLIQGGLNVGFFKPDLSSEARQTLKKDFPQPPVFAFTRNGQTNLTIGSLKGKVVFINFWASWCPPCLAEMPGIEKLYQHLGNDSNFVFMMVDADGDINLSSKFMADHNYHLPVVKMVSGHSPGLFSGTLPTTLVINKAGEPVFHEEGVANYETKMFADFLQQLAAE